MAAKKALLLSTRGRAIFNGIAPAYNLQTAVDAEHGLILAQQVTTDAVDNRNLLPMAEAAALGGPETLNVIADAGYSNGEQAAQCEAHGIVPHVPANRAVNSLPGHRGLCWQVGHGCAGVRACRASRHRTAGVRSARSVEAVCLRVPPS